MNHNVSIIIPVFQVAPYIGDCLLSVMRQTYKGGIECLIIDDCGTDDSIAIAERMIEEYNFNLNNHGNGKAIRFRVIHHERNRGLSAARNTGIEQATGEWIFFLDSDDEISEHCIDLLMEKAKENDSVELVQGETRICPYSKLSRKEIKWDVPYASTNKETRRCFYELEQFRVSAWNKLIKRSLIIENNLRFMEGVLFEDNLWTFMLLKYLKSVSFANDITYYYKRREGSIVTSSNSKEKADSFLTIYRQVSSNLTQGYERQETNYYGKGFAYSYARYSMIVPAYKDDMKQWQMIGKEYGNNGIRIRLSLGRMLGKVRYGWLLLSLLYRIEHPTVISSDVRRIMQQLR